MVAGEDAATHYDARRQALGKELEALEERSSKLSTARGLLFLGALALAIAAWTDVLGTWAGPAAGGCFALFIGLVVVHALNASKRTAAEERLALVEESLGRLAGKTPDAAATGDAFMPAAHPYAGDLDLFGKTSLFRLVNRAETLLGQREVARWLLEPASPKEIADRQTAAKDLVARRSLRETLRFFGRRSRAVHFGATAKEGEGAQEAPMLEWAKQQPALGPGGKRPGPFGLLGAALVVTTVALFSASLVWSEPSWLGRAFLAPLLLQVALLMYLRGAIEPSITLVSSRQSPFGRYRSMLAGLEQEPFEAERLQRLKGRLVEQGKAPASEAMQKLETIIGFADLRHNTIVHLLANLGFLYDLWVARALDAWRKQYGASAPAWLETIAEAEALASLAGMSDEEPEVTWPVVEEGEPAFAAERLAHPLLDPKTRVANDVALGAGEPPMLLITGSNMSGKSTMLRAIGTNAALAQAGAPVCAQRLSMRPVAVQTSMRVRDDLSEGVSHFYAELRRLKEVLDAAEKEPVLFLLDEILHGTNSRERNIGGEAIALRLLELGAVGLISSHDLGLTRLEGKSGGRILNCHFQEQVQEGTMTFDYRLRAGVVQSSNALRLMAAVGLSLSFDESGVDKVSTLAES